MEKDIPVDMMIDLMLAAGDTLEITDEGEDVRMQGSFTINNDKVDLQ